MNRFIKQVLNIGKKTIKKRIKKNENPIRWGIIGTGYMAGTFCRAIDGNANGVVAAVASRTLEKAKKFASKYGDCRYYGSYAELVRDNTIDVIYIATPVLQHYENIKLCLEGGQNVICEKPITQNADELIDLKKIAEKNNCFLMEGMWMKCLPSYQKAIAWVSEGKVGNIQLIKADFYKREQINPTYAIFNKNSGGGVLKDFGVYALAFPTGFLSENITVNGYFRKSTHEIDSDWLIHMQAENVQAFINISSNFKGESKAAVIGDRGTIEWNAQFNRTNIITLYNAAGTQIDQFKATYEFEGFEYEVNEVQKCIRKGLKESEMVPLNVSIITLKMIDALMKDM